MEYDLIIAGGGAAGCFAAAHAAAEGLRVLVLDGNDRLMHKLSITGKGRCNLTNACDPETLMRNILRNPRFLYSAFSRCAPQDVMDYFEQCGVPLKIERGRRVFPVSDQAKDIVAALLGQMKAHGAEIRLRTPVKRLLTENGRCVGVQAAGGAEFRADAVLLATGGMSYPRTGSRGDGYRLAEQAGHTVKPPQPSLIPLETAEQDAAQMQGLSLRNVTLTVKNGKKTLFSEQGEMLFTHFGISGPLVLSASCLMDSDKLNAYELRIDLKPALTPEQLDQRLLRDFAEVPNRALSNVLKSLLPASMIPVILARAGLSGSEKVNSVTREQRRTLGETVKSLCYHVSAMRPIAEAIVTRGGVSVREVNPNTMESKLMPGLYFAGELLDTDGFTGGYNLQIAFATAYTAAAAISERKNSLFYAG
ncbi:MAG: NAD(P)/FAD-dependent oxidoreductase [Oscillospiraceae bacterium]|nr:NAD(P)/FAD-dependent oxidoreductase [Oscillospiraceae bacterium]